MNSQRRDVVKLSLIEEGKKQALMKLLGAMKLLVTVQNNTYENEIILSKVQKRY